MNRREFFSNLLKGSLGSFLFLNCNNHSQNTTHYSSLFLNKCLEIFRNIQSQELAKLFHSAHRGADLYLKEGRLYSQLITEFLITYENSQLYTENPRYLTQIEQGNEDHIVDKLQRGDFLVTTAVTEAIFQAKKRGVYVLGISTPHLPNAKIFSNQIIRLPEWYMIEEVANEVLYSYVPFTDGLVQFPEYPMVPLCPGNTIVKLCYFWMLNSELAYCVQTLKPHPFVSKARIFLEMIINRIYEFMKQLSRIQQIAARMAENVQSGGRLYIYDKTYLLTKEACNRTSGLKMFRPLILEDIKPNDIVIFASEKPGDENDISLLRQLIQKKAYVVTISPIQPRPENGSLLHEEANAAIDNLSATTEDITSYFEITPQISSTSSVLNVILLWTLTAQFISELINIGIVPYINMGNHLKGGEAYNAAIRTFFNVRGF